MKEKHIILNACNALLLIQISDKLSEAFSVQFYLAFPLFVIPALNYFSEFPHCRDSSRHKIPDPADSCSTRKTPLALCRLSAEIENIADRII